MKYCGIQLKVFIVWKKLLQIFKDFIKNYYFDDVTCQNRKEFNPGWLQIRHQSARVLIIRGSGSVKTNALLNLVNHQPDIDKIYIYAKDP